jgi:topoisomerase-4 subunit B
MNPAKRTLIQVSIGEAAAADDQISILMGDDVEPRREWIENHVVFDTTDNFVLDDVEGELDE